MSKVAIDQIKVVAEQVSEGGQSLADLMSKNTLGLEETLRYRLPISVETKAYYEAIQKGLDVDKVISDIEKSENLGQSSDAANISGTLYAQKNQLTITLNQSKGEAESKRISYFSNPNDKNLKSVYESAKNTYEFNKREYDDIVLRIQQVENKTKHLSAFKNSQPLDGIKKNRQSETNHIINNIPKFSLSQTPLTHHMLPQNNPTPVKYSLGSSIFNAHNSGQSYVFYDEQSQKETQSDSKDGTVTCSVLLKDGNYKEVKIKGLYIDNSSQEVIFDKIQVEGVEEADFPLQIRSLNVRGILQDGGREYYMDKQLSLTINQGAGTLDKDIALTAVQSHFGNHLYRYINQHISRPNTSHSEYKKMIMEELKKHNDFVTLSEYHQQALFDQLVADGGTLYGLINNLNVANPSYDGTNDLTIDRHVAFANYIKSKKVDPQPTSDDMKSQTDFQNWLSRNMDNLVKNFVAHHMRQLLDRTDIATTINQQIINYAGAYEGQQLHSITATADNAKDAASKLRNQRPSGASATGLNKRIGKNDSRLRLMAGKSATMSDTVKMEDGTEKSYTATLNTRTGKGMSVTLTLPDGKDMTLVSPTPGDLLAKILTSARIDESQGGQRMRLMMAFGTIKALVKLARDAGAPLENIPINGTRDEYRITLDDNDNISFARYNYNNENNEFEIGTPAFDEKNPDHKFMMTHNFITDLNSTLNTVLDSHYGKFKETMSNGTNVLKRAWRFMTFDRERMIYEADANIFGVRTIRGWMNHKHNNMQSFDFPIQAGNKQGSVSYDPKGIITITIDGKVRKGKNLAKLINPWTMRNFFGVFQRKDNMTDGMEMQIMNGMYSNLTSQLMQNEKVSRYTYLVRDPVSKVMYACYKGEDGNPRMGIIEHTDQNNMLLMDRQRTGRHVGIPEQGVRELNEKETQALLSRADIMDNMVQNMLKRREERIRIPVGGYRSASLTANVASQLAIAGAVGGVDMLTGGRLSTNAAAAAHATGQFTTGEILPKVGEVVSNTGKALGHAVTGGWDVARQTTIGLGEGIAHGTKMVA